MLSKVVDVDGVIVVVVAVVLIADVSTMSIQASAYSLTHS